MVPSSEAGCGLAIGHTIEPSKSNDIGTAILAQVFGGLEQAGSCRTQAYRSATLLHRKATSAGQCTSKPVWVLETRVGAAPAEAA
jgi:hypothetical protein